MVAWRFMACSDLGMRDSWMVALIDYRRSGVLVHRYLPDWELVGLLDI
jgi:hypothetical protein